MKWSNNIEILDKVCDISQEEVEPYMDFDSLWSEYELTKDTFGQILIGVLASIDSQVIKRTLRTASMIVLFGIFSIKEDVNIKQEPQPNTIELPKSKRPDQVKIIKNNIEEEIAYSF